MDLRKRLLLITRLIGTLVLSYIVIQYILVRDHYDAAKVVPVLIGLVLFFIFIDRILKYIPEERFKIAFYALMLVEMYLVGLLIYFTRANPILGYFIDLAFPAAIVALWFGIKEGALFSFITCIFFTGVLAFSGHLTNPGIRDQLLAVYILVFIIPYVAGYLAETGERERKEKAKRMVELTALSGFATVFDSALIESKVYESLTNAVSRTIEADVVLTFAFDAGGRRLSVTSSHGVSEAEADLRIPGDYGLVGEAIETQETILVENTDEDPRYRRLLESQRIRSAIYAPLKWREEVYGVIYVGNLVKFGLDENDANLLAALAVQAALAIHNSKLYSDLEDRIGELHAIFEIDKAITSAIDLETVLQQIVQMSIGLLDAQVSSIMLLDEENEELIIAAAHGLSEHYIKKGPVKIGESVAGRVIQGGRPIAVGDIREDPRHAYSDYARAEGLCSLLSVPLNLKDRVIGVLNIYTNDFHDFSPHEINLFTSMASQAAIAIENARLFESLEEIYIEVITALASAIDARDAYTHGHSQRVTEYAVDIAENIDISPAEVDIVRNASILHDVGKIGIKEDILKKPGRLTEEERKEMESHPMIGARILQSVKLLEPVLPLVRSHHEWFAGGGYPDGLRGEEIPLGARIISVADAFESMTSDRPYRKALPVEDALTELRKGSGRQFDPRIVKVFLGLVDEGKIDVEWSHDKVITLSDRISRTGP